MPLKEIGDEGEDFWKPSWAVEKNSPCLPDLGECKIQWARKKGGGKFGCGIRKLGGVSTPFFWSLGGV